MIGRAASWIGDKVLSHPSAIVGGAAALGLYRAHPLRKFGGLGMLTGAIPGGPLASLAAVGAIGENNSVIAEALLGDPNAIGTTMRAGIAQGLRTGIRSSMGNAVAPRAYDSYPIGAPNGSIVFGLYNGRLK